MPLPQTAENIVNVAPVVLPATSLIIIVYVPFHAILVPLMYVLPLIVAVTHGLLSARLITMPDVYVTPLVAHENVGGILSIRLTVAVAVHVFPTMS